MSPDSRATPGVPSRGRSNAHQPRPRIPAAVALTEVLGLAGEVRR